MGRGGGRDVPFKEFCCSRVIARLLRHSTSALLSTKSDRGFVRNMGIKYIGHIGIIGIAVVVPYSLLRTSRKPIILTPGIFIYLL